jgi:hypothetical protein
LEKDRPVAHQKNMAEAEYICFFPVLLSSYMKLPSLHHVAAEAARVGRRFPLTLLCGLLLGAVFIYYQRLDYEQSTKLKWLFPVLSAAGLGLTLNVALAGERYRWPWWGRVLAATSAVGLLVLWYALVPAEPNLIWAM